MTEEEYFTKNGIRLKFNKSDVLIRTEEEPTGIFYLESGIVKMSNFFSDGTEITFNLYKPGSFFPMIWAITGAKNIYDFQAVTDVVIYKVSKKEALQFIENDKEVYSKLIKRIMIGFDGLLGSLPYLLSGTSDKRVAAAIILLSRRFGQTTEDGLMLNIKIRHEDLAGMAALARETVSLAIGKLEKENIIEQKNRFIIIKQVEELKNIAGLEDLSLPSTIKSNVV